MQDFVLKNVQIKTRVALEDTTVDLPLCRDLSSNRLVAIHPNLFLSLEDLLQLWVLFAQIRTRIYSSEYENSSVNVLLVNYKPWGLRSSAVPWLQLRLWQILINKHKYNCAYTRLQNLFAQNQK